MALAPVNSPVLNRHQIAERLLLTMSAGAVNAGALLACQRFVSHVTGTMTLIGINLKSFYLMAEYLLVLLCFLIGATAAVFMIARGPQERHPTTALRIVAIVIALIAPMGMSNLFGPIGQSVETPGDFVLLSMLSFAMGMLNATTAVSTAIGARVTHLTGHATDLGINVARIFVPQDEEERAAATRRVHILLGKFFCFAVGASIMVAMVRWCGYAAFLAPATITVMATELGRFSRRVRIPHSKPAS